MNQGNIWKHSSEGIALEMSTRQHRSNQHGTQRLSEVRAQAVKDKMVPSFIGDHSCVVTNHTCIVSQIKYVS